jgi:hypothetical protein
VIHGLRHCRDGTAIAVGSMRRHTCAVPGRAHAIESGDAVFAGGTLFMPDVRTARSGFMLPDL